MFFPKFPFKLFGSCVAPILLYGAETWGFDNMDVIENVHARFCKIITKKRVNIAIIPLFIVNLGDSLYKLQSRLDYLITGTK